MAFNYAAFEKSSKDEKSFDYDDFEKKEEDETLPIRDTHPGGSVAGWPSGTVAPALQFGAGNIISEKIQEVFPVEKPEVSAMGTYDKPVPGAGMSEGTYKTVSGLGRVAGGALAWSTDLVTNPIKAVTDFAGFMVESGKEWNEVRKTLQGDPHAMLKLVNAFAEMPVDELALLGGIPLAAFGIRGGIKTAKGKLGKAKAKAGLEEILGDKTHITDPGKTQPLADQLAPGLEAQMREIAKSRKIQKIEEAPDALQGKEAQAPKAQEVAPALRKTQDLTTKQPWEMTKGEFFESVRDEPMLQSLRQSKHLRKELPIQKLIKNAEQAVDHAYEQARQSGVAEYELSQGRLSGKSTKKRTAALKKYTEAQQAQGALWNKGRQSIQNEIHRASIEQAHTTNKPVPAEVLAEYPELGKGAVTPEVEARVGKAPEAAKQPDVVGERQPVFAEEVSAMETGKTAGMRGKEAEMAKKQRVPSEESQAQAASLERADAVFNEQRSYFEGINKNKETIAEMDTYENFKDVAEGPLGGSKPPEYFLAEIDGALPLGVKKNLPGQAGPVERSVYWRTNDITMRKMDWADAQTGHLKSIFEGVTKEQDIALTEILNRMNRKTAYVDPASLATGYLGKIKNATPELIDKAQQIRKWYEHTFKQQNTSRTSRGQKPIEYRNKYSPEIIREMTLRERLFGLEHTMNEVMKSQQVPDFINRWPGKPFNPRELARRGGIPEMLKEQRASKLTESYANSAARDIFDSDIIVNNKAVANKLDALGYNRSANAIQNWTAEAFGHVEAVMDRKSFGQMSPGIERTTRFLASRMRLGYVRGAFPANIAWNSFVQTSSSVLTVGKYGTRNSAAAVFDWFGNSKLRAEIASTYAATMKSAGKGDPSSLMPRFRGRTGSVTRQDINTGVSRLVTLNKGKLETATDALNYITEVVERNITGWSIATGLRHGKGAGLKGEALWRYASDAGAKTQGMYNIENLPGVLRSGAIKTAAPFQTFSFNCWNLVKEWSGITGTPPTGAKFLSWQSARIRGKSALRFLGTATAMNYISHAAIGRKPWELSSLNPFYSIVAEPMERIVRDEAWKGISTRSGLPAPAGIAMEAYLAAEDIGTHGDLTRARRWFIRNVPGWLGIPGGIQANRVVDGTLAIIAGEVSNKDDETMFDVEEFSDQIKAIFGGVWTTSEAREYWEERESKLDVLPEEGIATEVIEHIPVVGDILGKEESGW